MKKSLKSFLLILLSALTLILFSCNSWMTDDGFYTAIETDVKVANAPQMTVNVRYAVSKQGKTDPDGPATFKLEIPSSISAVTEPEYGFVRWAAFSKDYFASGDNQNQNKDILFIDTADYEERILPNEIPSPTVEFEDASNPTTMVTINELRNDIYLVPIVAQRPAIAVTIPARGSSNQVRNISVRLNFSKPMDPESFKNEEGKYDKITITQGNRSFNSDGDIEIDSEDITDRFELSFSKNQKMVTLKFKPEALSEGYTAQSSVNINVSKEVRDTYGFAMTDDDKITFSVGSDKDSLAPYIVQLTAGDGSTVSGSRINYDSFKGVYKDANTTATGSAISHIEFDGAVNAPLDNIESTWYDTETRTNDNGTQTVVDKYFLNNRVRNRLILRVVSKDLAGSDDSIEVNEQTSNELDVAMIGIRAKHLYNADGTPSDVEMSAVSPYPYVPKSNKTESISGDYSSLISDSNLSNEGTLLEYDLSELPDGLIRLDVAAVDLVGNSGFADGGLYSSKFGNAWTSLFVVKDTTAPDAASNVSKINPALPGNAAGTDNYYNATNYQQIYVTETSSTPIVDSGHSRLSSGGNGRGNLKWMFLATADTGWPSSVSTTDSRWALISNSSGYTFSSFPAPSVQGTVSLTYALMDDLGNKSSAVALSSIKYDSVAPTVTSLSAPANTQTNNVDIQFTTTDATSGVKTLNFTVTKAGGGGSTSPLSASDLEIWCDGTLYSGYTKTGSQITFTPPLGDASTPSHTIQIKNFTIDDASGDGNYTIAIQPTDRALNQGSSTTATITRDSTEPVIEKVVPIAGLRPARSFSGATLTGTSDYWADASGLSSGLASVEVTFVENNSGAKVFNFNGSTFSVTSSTTIYNKATNAQYTCTPDASTNTVTLSTPIYTDTSGTPLTVVVTGLSLTTATTGNTLALKLSDAAGNNSSQTTQYTLADDSNLTVFYYAATAPTLYDNLILKDRTSYGTDTNQSNAEDEFTNEPYVDATFRTNDSSSGIYRFTVSGATFVASGTNQTKVYASTNGSSYTQITDCIIDSSTTVTFKSGSDFALFRNSTYFKIENVCLPGGDSSPAGVTPLSVSISTTSLGGTSSAISDSITLDMQAPSWNTDPLYTLETSENIYPRSSNGTAKAYGLSGIDSTNPNEIYFYSNNISMPLHADFTDQNLTADSDSCLYVKVADGSTTTFPSTTETYGPYTDFGVNISGSVALNVFIKDKAGNKSAIKTIHIISDTAFADSTDEAKIDQYMTLYKPDGAFIYRNAVNAGGTTYYIIKQDAQYQIKVKLGGASSTDESLDSLPVSSGGTQLLTTVFARKDNTTTSSMIEKYYVSTSSTVSDSYWKNYAETTTANTTDGISSTVDSSGTISINLPNTDCNPLYLFLRDACGNAVVRAIKPANWSGYLGWTVDSGIGMDNCYGEIDYTNTTTPNADTSFNDVTFYNNTITLRVGTYSETCRYETDQVTGGGPGTSSEYTLRTRIISWTSSGTPSRDNFYSTTLGTAASDWSFRKQSNSPTGNTAFWIENTFPLYAHSSTYKLFYIVEDKVGNYEIKQIRRASNGNIILTATNSSDGVQGWLYDATAPGISTLGDSNFHKINQVDGTNYYSDNSYITYDITDSGSGIKYDGQNEIEYPSAGFNSTDRKTSIPKTYSLNEVTSLSQITGIKDYAGNEHDPITLTYNSSSTWVQQSEAPVLDTTKITAAKATAATLGTVTPDLVADSSTGGQHLKIKAKSKTTAIKVTLGVTDSTQLLGWIISPTAIATSDFYTASQMSSGMTYVSASNTYTYTYSKIADWHTEWRNDTAGGTKYFYPVNRAGLIGKPVKVEFVENLIPEITSAGLTYNTYGTVDTSADSPTTYSITSEGSGTDAIYYLKSGSSLSFAAVNNPTSARIYYGTGDDDYVSFNLSSGSTYSIPLDDSSLQTHLSSTSGTALRLTIHTADEDSGDYDLTGPSTGPESNKWVYDTDAPTVSNSNFVSLGYPAGSETGAATVTGDSTQYIQSDTAKVTLTYSDTGVSGIAHYQWKVGTAAWTDIGTPLTESTGVVEFAAPAQKTSYQFRVIDHAGNISTPPPAVTIQKDKWGPDGNLTYSTDNTNFDYAHLDNAELNGSERDESTRIINYSNNSSVTTAYITKINVDFSAITDKRNSSDQVDSTSTGIERSGIDHFEITKNNPTPLFFGDDADIGTRTFDVNTSTAEIDLSYTDNVSLYTYVIKAVDKLGQSTILKTLKVRQDSQAPALSINTIHADEDKNIPAVTSANTSDTTKYLKGDKAVITFTIDDPDATYCYSAGSSVNTSNPTPIPESARTITSDTLTYTFIAPDEKITYYFRAKDGIGNWCDEISVKLQRDKWEPSGDLTYTFRDNTTTKTLSTDLDSAYNSDEDYRDIKFSSVTGTTNYLKYIDIDLSAITDTVDGKARSGIENYYVAVDGSSASPISSSSISSGIYTITLPTNGTKTYAFSVKDNIGQNRDLKTFRFTADNSAPSLSLAATNPVKTYASTDSTDIHNVTAINNGTFDIYFMKKDKSQISFTIDDATATYMWKKGAGNWTEIPDENKNISGTTLTVTDGTPESVTLYSFKAVDGVLNESSEDGIQMRLMQDYDAPSGTPTYALKNGSDPAVTGTYTDNSGTIRYKVGSVTKLVLDLSSIAENAGGSGLEGYYLNGTKLTSSGSPKLESDNTVIITLATTDAVHNTYTITAKDKVGNESAALLSLDLTSDASAPDLDLARPNTVGTDSEHSVYYKSSNTTWYTNGTNAIINFTKSDTDIATYEMSTNGTDWTNITSTTGLSTGTTHTLEAPDSAITYYFRATDTVGNTSEAKSVTIVKDTDGPAGTLTYSLKKDASATGDSDKLERENTETTPSTITVGYNKSAANQLVFTVTGITDDGSGIDKFYYKKNGGSLTELTDNTITGLNTLDNGSAYEIIVKDNLGNATTLQYYILRGVSGGPKVENEKAPQYSGLHYVPTYPYVENANAKTGATWTNQDKWIKGFDTDNDAFYLTNGSTTAITEPSGLSVKIFGYNSDGTPKDGDTANTDPSGYGIRQLNPAADGTTPKFRLPVVSTSLPSNKLYWAFTYNSIVEPGSWTEATVDTYNGKSCIKDIPIDLSQITKRHTIIFVWYKDELGNICVHNLTYPGQTSQNWWTTAASKGTDGDFSDLNGSTFTYRSAGNFNGRGWGNRILGGDISDSEKPLTRVVDWFSSISDTFANEADTSVTKKISEKPVKAAKKTVKKPAKKAKAKTIAQTPAPVKAEEVTKVTEVVEAVENLVVETTKAVEKPVLETAKPAASTVAETTKTNAVEATEKSSSKTSVIVVMIAILAACGGAWFTLSRRKK